MIARRLHLVLLPMALLGGAAEPPAPDTPSTRVTATRGPVQVVAELSPANALAGDPITWTITIQAEAGVNVPMPLVTPVDGRIGSFNVLHESPLPDLPLADGRREFGQVFTLDTFEPGTATIDAMPVTFIDSRGTPALEGTIAVPSMEITSALLEGETAFRPVHDLHALPVSGMSPWWWALLPVSVLLLVGGVLFTRRGAVGAAVELTPAERARRDLLALEQDQLLERGEQDTYFARVTDILRLYLEARFDLHAPRKTTREFLNDAERDAALEPNHRAVLHRLLQLADLVKFARHEPHVDAGHDAMRTARTFVDDTEPTSEPHTQTLEPAGGAA